MAYFKVNSNKKEITNSIYYSPEELKRIRDNYYSNRFINTGDYITNSPSEYNYCISESAIHLANETAQRWQCYPSYVGEIPAGSSIVGTDPDTIQEFIHTAFLYAVTKNDNYGLAIKRLLLWQANEPSCDFSNATRFTGVWNDLNPSFPVASIVHRWLYSFVMTENLFSESEKKTMQEFFLKIAIFYKDLLVNPDLEGVFSTSRYSETWSASGDTSTIQSYTHYNGNANRRPSRFYNNRRAICAMLFGMIGLHLHSFGHSITPANVGLSTALEVDNKIMECIDHSILYWKETLIFGTYPDYLLSDMYRFQDIYSASEPIYSDSAKWTPSDPTQHESGFTYAMLVANTFSVFACALKRMQNIGKLNDKIDLLNYSTSAGLENTIGGTKSLQNIVNKICRIYRQESDSILYATYDSAVLNSNYLIDGKIVSPYKSYINWLGWFIEPNELSWNNEYIRETTKISGVLTFDTLANSGSSGAFRAQCQSHGLLPNSFFSYFKA